MMNSPCVSVIICTYRREQTLCCTIKDILDQTYQDIEIIIVDQTPEHEPETEEFVREHADRLRLLRLDHANLPNARNRGVEVAQGHIVVFLDDDVRVGSDLIGRLVAHFDDVCIDAVAPVVADSLGAVVATEQYVRKYGHFIRSRTGPLLPAHDVIGACVAVRREVIKDVGGFDVKLGQLHRSASGEDLEFFRRVSAHGYRIFVDSSLVVTHLISTPGGCDVRTGDLAEAQRAQLHALVYMTMKEDRAFNRIRPWTWVRLARLCLQRRYILWMDLAGFYRKVVEVINAVKYVRSFTQAVSSSPEE